jgi:hypothetical protein
MLGITPTERLRKLMERERYNEARAKVLEQARIIHTWASSHAVYLRAGPPHRWRAAGDQEGGHLNVLTPRSSTV